MTNETDSTDMVDNRIVQQFMKEAEAIGNQHDPFFLDPNVVDIECRMVIAGIKPKSESPVPGAKGVVVASKIEGNFSLLRILMRHVAKEDPEFKEALILTARDIVHEDTINNAEVVTDKSKWH